MPAPCRAATAIGSPGDLDETDRSLAARVIYNLNDNGFLEEDLEAIAERANVDVAQAEKVLQRVQAFDPVGVAARNLSECLMAQANKLGLDDPLVLKIIAGARVYRQLSPIQRHPGRAPGHRRPAGIDPRTLRDTGRLSSGD